MEIRGRPRLLCQPLLRPGHRHGAELAQGLRRAADFIHVEVWQHFESKVPNPAANTWLNRDQTFNEPWLFVIGPDGKVVARWDNLFTRSEVTSSLDDLIRIA